jgi:hypothetical protein
MTFLTPIVLPDLPFGCAWTKDGETPIFGQAAQVGLGRCNPTIRDYGPLKCGRWVLDKPTYSWTQTHSILDALISSEPTFFEGHCTENIIAVFVDKTAILGMKFQNEYIWCPFAIHFPQNPPLTPKDVDTLCDTIKPFINNLPQLSHDQSYLQTHKTYRIYNTIGNPLSTQQRQKSMMYTSYLRDRLTQILLPESPGQLQIILKSQKMTFVQSLVPCQIILDGILHTDETDALSLKVALFLNTYPEEIGLCSRDLFHTSRKLYIGAQTFIFRTTSFDKTPSSHQFIALSQTPLGRFLEKL